MISAIFYEINAGIYSTTFSATKTDLKSRDMESKLLRHMSVASLNANYVLRGAANINNIPGASESELEDLLLFTKEGHFLCTEETISMEYLERIIIL